MINIYGVLTVLLLYCTVPAGWRGWVAGLLCHSSITACEMRVFTGEGATVHLVTSPSAPNYKT